MRPVGQTGGQNGTLKLEPIWIARYEGGVAGEDQPRAFVLDEKGFLYLTGISYGSGLNGVLTIKCNSEGTIEWADLCREGHEGHALGVDREGNVYVGCYDRNRERCTFALKYSLTGRLLWTARWDSAIEWIKADHLVLMPDGMLYVAGAIGRAIVARVGGGEETRSERSAFMLKLDASGRVKWVRSQSAERPQESVETFALLAAPDGSLYWLTRFSREVNEGLVQYLRLTCWTADGKQRWQVSLEKELRGNPLSVVMRWCPNGTLALAGLLQSRYLEGFLQGYSAVGKRLWGHRWRLPKAFLPTVNLIPRSQTELLLAVQPSPKGDRFVDLRCYTLTGVLRWRREVPIAAGVLLTHLLRGKKGEPYLVGRQGEMEGTFVLYRLSPDGRLQGQKRWQPEGYRNLYVAGTALNGKEHLNLGVGLDRGNGRGRDVAFVQFTPQGEPRWVRTYDHRFPGSAERSTVLLPSPDGGTFVGGWQGTNGAGGLSRFWLARFSPDGKLLWSHTSKEVAREIPGTVLLSALALAPEGDFYAGGLLPDRGERPRLTIMRWASDGSLRWQVELAQPERLPPFPVKIAPCPDGSLYLLATVESQRTAHDWLIAHLNQQGQVVWSHLYNGDANGDDEAFALTTDSQGNLYAAGLSERTEDDPGIVLLGYSPEGQQRWLARIEPSSVPSDAPRPAFGVLALAVDTARTLRLLLGEQKGRDRLRLYVLRYTLQGDRLELVEYGEVSSSLRRHFAGCFTPDGSLWAPVYQDQDRFEGNTPRLFRRASLQLYDPLGTRLGEVQLPFEEAQMMEVQATACEGENALFVALDLKVRVQDTPYPLVRNSMRVAKYRVQKHGR